MSDAPPLSMRANVIRCNACGAEAQNAVEEESIGDGLRHPAALCPRSPRGHIVSVPLNCCAIASCAVAKRGQPLPSANHFADHMDWHRREWAKEKADAGAGTPPPAPRVRTFDHWSTRSFDLEPHQSAPYTLTAPPTHPIARCVALLVHSPHIDAFMLEYEPLGGTVPLGAYIVRELFPIAALVPIPPALERLSVRLKHEGNAPPTHPRIAGRWECSDA